MYWKVFSVLLSTRLTAPVAFFFSTDSFYNTVHPMTCRVNIVLHIDIITAPRLSYLRSDRTSYQY